MADPTGGFQQPCPWQNANIPAVLTVRGNIGDADLPHRLNAISTWLQQMAQKGEQEVKVSRVQPWNSVRVTFNIPRSAAQRLQQLAETRNQQLRDLGILAVQVEGHQEVVLNTPPPMGMTGPPMAPGLPSTAAPPFQQSPQGVPRPAWATSPGGQVAPGEGMIPAQFSPVGNIRPPSAAQVPAFSFTAKQMGTQNRMPMPSPGGFVRPPQDQLPFRPDQVPSNAGGPPEQGGFPPTPQNFPRGFPPGFHPDGSAGFPGNQGPPGPMQGQMLPSMQVRGGATRLPVHHLLHNAGLAQAAGGGDPNLQGRDVTQSSPLLVNLLQNDISGNPNISLAISRTTQSLMQQGGMQGNLQQQLAMLQQSGLLPQGNMASPGALQSMLQQAGMLQQQQEQQQQQQQQQPPPKKPAKRRDRSRARQRNKSNQQVESAGLHNVPPLPSPQSAMSPALSAGSPALSASPNLAASPSMAGVGGMTSPSTQHFPSAPSPSLQQGFPSTSSPSLPPGFPRNSSPAVQNNFPTTSSPAVPPNYPSTSSPAVPPNFPPSSSPMQQGFPPSSSPAMQMPTSTSSMPPGFPATSASGMPPGAQPHFGPPTSVAMQQPGFPGMPAHGNMTQQHQNFPNNPSPSYQQAMGGPNASPMHTPFSNAPSPTMQQNFPRTSQSQSPMPQNFQGPFPNRAPQPGMQQFANPSQMFPNLPPNAQSPFPNMNQRFPNPNSSQPSFPMTSSPSQQQQPQFPNMSQQQQRFPPSSSPNFQPPFPNTSTPNTSMAAFISQMQNSAAKAMSAMPNKNVPPHMMNMRDGARGMNEGPSPLASLSNQVGQVPQPPMPPGMGQQRPPGPNKQQAMPPGGVKDVPFDPPTSAHSFLQGQAEFQSAFLRYVQSQQRQPPPRGGRRASPGAAAPPGLAGLGPRGAPAPPRAQAPQPGMMFPHPGGPGQAPGSASPHQPPMEPPLGQGAHPQGPMGPNNGTPKVPDKLSETPSSNTTTPPGQGAPHPLGHPSMGLLQGPNGSTQLPPVSNAPPPWAGGQHPGVGRLPPGAGRLPPGAGTPPSGARGTPPVTTALPSGVGAPPPGAGTPPVTTAPPTGAGGTLPVTTAPPPGFGVPTPGTGTPPGPRGTPPGPRGTPPGPRRTPPSTSGLSPRMVAPVSHSPSPTAGKTPGPDTSQQNQSLPDLSSVNQSQPDQAGKSAGDNTASQTPPETNHGQPQVPSEPPGGNGTASRVAAEPDNMKEPSSTLQPVTHEVTTEKAGTETGQEQGSSPSVPPEVQGNGKPPCTASQVEPQPDVTGTGQDKPEGEGENKGEGVSKGGAQEVAMDTSPPKDSGSEMSGKEASEGGGGGKGETVGMATEVVATPSNQKESIPVSSTETPSSTDAAVQSVVSQQRTEAKQTVDVQQKNTTAETGNNKLPPAGETGTAGPTEKAGKDSEVTAAVQQDLPGGAESCSTTNSNPGPPPSDGAPGTDEKKGEEKTPEVPSPSQEQTAKKRELPKDLEEKGPSPHKQSKS
ncbi:collagen alpha-1(I) chain-like isoform X3 [Branchiostoma lanceolatum]|uniref:collagen alpha-1(I) chain-like isoform X3 n=1 Tax=Branchiostoma lanceolatum TaxID=7740 RepID=UPI003452F20B